MNEDAQRHGCAAHPASIASVQALLTSIGLQKPSCRGCYGQPALSTPKAAGSGARLRAVEYAYLRTYGCPQGSGMASDPTGLYPHHDRLADNHLSSRLAW